MTSIFVSHPPIYVLTYLDNRIKAPNQDNILNKGSVNESGMGFTVVICAINWMQLSNRQYSDCQNIGESAKNVVFLTHDGSQFRQSTVTPQRNIAVLSFTALWNKQQRSNLNFK